MEKLPLIVRKAIDFDIWFNRKVLKWTEQRNLNWVFAGANSTLAKEYIKNKFDL
jgi:hypothetical protein